VSVSIAILLLIAIIAAGAIIYPLLPGRTASRPAPALRPAQCAGTGSTASKVVTDGDIEQAVRDLRRARGRRDLSCPACGKAYQAGDRFCVRCGAGLPEPGPAGQSCPSCGADLHKGDLFCPKCGRSVPAGEAT
jgi:hypothetical protein